jgi:hypothetical protein
MAKRVESSRAARRVPVPRFLIWHAAAVLLCAIGSLPAKAQPASCTGPDPSTALCRNLKETDCGENCCSFNATDKRAALIIGNDNYEGDLPPLRNAVNDACTMAAELKAQKFDKVCCLLNAKISHMSRAITASTQHLDRLDATVPQPAWQNTRFVMYFAGHGAHVKPADSAEPPKTTVVYGSGRYNGDVDLDSNFRSINVIRNQWAHYKSVAPVIIVDACRSEANLLPVQLREPPAPAPQTIAFAAARALPAPLPQRRDLPAGYVVLYSTKAGAAALDVSAASVAGQPGQGRFMRYFSQEIRAWGRTLGDVFETVKVQVEKEALGAQPPDGQQPDRSFEGPSFAQAKWRQRAEDPCTGVMNAVGQAINQGDDTDSRCAQMPYAECLKPRTGLPTEQQCAMRKFQLSRAQAIPGCLAAMNTEFKGFFGDGGASCDRFDPQPVVAARDFRPNMSLAVARVETAARDFSRRAGGTMPEIVVQDRAELRAPARSGARNSARASPGRSEFVVDCFSPGATCGGGQVSVRMGNGALENMMLDTLRVRSAARSTIEVQWDTSNNVPEPASLDTLFAAAGPFKDRPGGIIRITAEVASGARYDDSLAEAEQRRGDLVLILRGAGLKQQKILNEVALLADGLVPSALHVEFFDGATYLPDNQR